MAEPRIIWVSPEGGGDGSEKTKPTTLVEALAMMIQSGDTLNMLDGLYSA